ncbi:MAG: AzlC family ABC transporter permease [Lachnospiraceae bacterium]|nr:AzlC family ABC transporter permease [Lachnospiraceae bacterium]
MSEFKCGLKDSIPIALGYLSVSFSFGILAIKEGLNVIQAGLTSLTNVTSAGQFAGLGIMVAGGTILEMILTQFIINLRYALMSLSMSQKLSEKTKFWHRLVIAFTQTDEVFAVAMAHNKSLTLKYMLGLQLPSIAGWTIGTVAGAIAGNLLPASVCTALGIALYGMFVAIVVPQAKKSRPVMIVVLIALVLSCIIYYVPEFSFVSSGISIIICTIAASAVGAWLFPRDEKEQVEE